MPIIKGKHLPYTKKNIAKAKSMGAPMRGKVHRTSAKAAAKKKGF